MPAKADTFIQALYRLEHDREVEPIAALFAPDADVSNPLVKHAHEGEGGAAAFWTSYRAAFETIHSEFRNIVEDEGASLLEWVSEGTSKNGPFRYGGVSVIEWGDGGITGFRRLFDPAQVLPPVKGG
jgi:hypothetical protein